MGRLILLMMLLVATAPAQEVKKFSFVTDPPGASVYKMDGEGEYHFLGKADGSSLTLSYTEKEKKSDMVFRFGLPQFGSEWFSEPLSIKGMEVLKSSRFPASGRHELHPGSPAALQARLLLQPVQTVLKLLLLPLLIGFGYRLFRRRSVAHAFALDGSLGKTGSYELKELLGEGGMATVYRGVSPEHGDHVAVKVLRNELSGDEEARKRFRREIQASLQLRHPNLMHLYDWGESSKGRLYLVCELLTGETLRERLQREQRLPRNEALRVLSEVAKALEHLHNNGLVHRDVKPANIFLCENGLVKLVDLGIARGMDLAAVTQTGKAMGTPRYMSPEQIRGETHQATDQYALALLAMELLSGTTLFAGKEPMEIMYCHAQGELPRVIELIPDASPRLQLVLKKMLALTPESRFETIGEALSALVAGAEDEAGDETADHTQGLP